MTPEQIERVLPSVPAGITSGDMTDHDDRVEFARRLAAIYAEAQRASSAPWPPPAKGTHESDLDCLSPYMYGGKTIVAGRAHDVWDDEALYEPAEWIVARDWSRA